MIDRELYLPKAWTEDRPRCRDAGIDDSIGFATKPELAQRMIERALDAEVPFGWVTADEAYGQVGQLRMWLESRGRTCWRYRSRRWWSRCGCSDAAPTA